MPSLRLALIATAILVATATPSCGPECTSLLDCAFGDICSATGSCIPEPDLPPIPCSPVDDSALFDPELGFPAGDTKWNCQTPGAAGGEGAHIVGVDGLRVAVTGSFFELEFPWQGEQPTGGVLVYGIEGNGYFARNIIGELSQPIRANLFVRPFAAGGTYPFFIGIDDHGGTQDAPQLSTIFRTDLKVIAVGSGDIQVNVSWDSVVDLDLHVFSPTEEHVFFGESTVESGGTLDLDSNVGCPLDEAQNENIVWPTGAAIDGEYRIQVNLFGSDCDVPLTHYRVTVLRALQVVEVVEGTLTTDEVGQNDGNGELVTTVVWPPP